MNFNLTSKTSLASGLKHTAVITANIVKTAKTASFVTKLLHEQLLISPFTAGKHHKEVYLLQPDNTKQQVGVFYFVFLCGVCSYTSHIYAWMHVSSFYLFVVIWTADSIADIIAYACSLHRNVSNTCLLCVDNGGGCAEPLLKRQEAPTHTQHTSRIDTVFSYKGCAVGDSAE